MAADNPSDKSFSVDADVAEVIGLLRENKMQWIADELESRIRQGISERATSEPRPKRKPKEYDDVRGMTPAEQTATLVRTLQNYILLAPRIWNDATTGLVNALAASANSQSLVIEIAPLGDDADAISVIDSKSQKIIDESWRVIGPFLPNLGIDEKVRREAKSGSST